MKGAGTIALSSLVVAACGGKEIPLPATETPDETAIPTIGASPEATLQPTSLADEFGGLLNSYEDITEFNNFY